MTGMFITCPECGREKADFLIRDGRCDSCRKKARRAVAERPALRWEDIRAERDRLLAASDWTQLPDVPEATRDLWRDYRQSLRDITKAESPAAVAWPDPPKGD